METSEGTIESLEFPEVWKECCIHIHTPVAAELQEIVNKKTLTRKTRVPFGQFQSIKSLKLYIKALAKKTPNATIEVTFT